MSDTIKERSNQTTRLYKLQNEMFLDYINKIKTYSSTNIENIYVKYMSDTKLNEIDIKNKINVEIKSIEDTFYKIMQENISSDEFSVGYEPKSSFVFKKLLNENKEATLNALQRLAMDFYHDEDISYGIVSLLSYLDYKEIYPVGQCIALSFGSYPNLAVKEALIRAFESWCNNDSLRFINKMRFEEEWLEDYRLTVISDIEEFCR